MPTAGSGHSAKLPPLPSASLIRRSAKGRVGALKRVRPGTVQATQRAPARAAPGRPRARQPLPVRRARQPPGPADAARRPPQPLPAPQLDGGVSFGRRWGRQRRHAEQPGGRARHQRRRRGQRRSGYSNYNLRFRLVQSKQTVVCLYKLSAVARSRYIKNTRRVSIVESWTRGTGKGSLCSRVEDKNSNMRMLKITTMDDLVKNSMNILEPSPVDATGNDREDVLSSSSPVDLLLLPGQAFDRTGRRLGRGGGYYDTFLMKYQELAKEKGWNQPLLVALSYSVQIMDEGVIPVNSTDVPIDALVSSSGVIPISAAALQRMH